MKDIYYAETGKGSCLEEAGNIEEAKKLILRDVGEYDGIQLLRKATKKDIAWVKAMGGWCPESEL